MPTFKNLRAFLKCRNGVTSIEYAIIAGIIVLAILGGVTSIGGSVSGALNTVNNGFSAGQPTSGGTGQQPGGGQQSGGSDNH